MVLAWRDKSKPTVMISMVHQVMMTIIDGRRGEIRMKPMVVDRYYSIKRKSKKWWRKLMFWLLEVAIVNSYILYK